jgi:hypothetical protein
VELVVAIPLVAFDDGQGALDQLSPRSRSTRIGRIHSVAGKLPHDLRALGEEPAPLLRIGEQLLQPPFSLFRLELPALWMIAVAMH